MILDWGAPLNDSCPEEKDGRKVDHSQRQNKKSCAGLGDPVFQIDI